MRLILMGQQAFGKAALDKLLETGTDEIVAVYCAPDKESRPIDPLKQAALDAGLTVLQPAGFRDEQVIREMREFDADLMIMAYVTLFVPEAARDAPRLGSICFHPSLLPLHRGPSSINWPIIGGATRTGFSWFYPTDGLDEGDILLQWECEIGPDDTLGDVYFKKIFPAAIDSISEVCELFRGDNPPRQQQDESKATYESWCRKKDAEIDWKRPANEIYNLIRGTNPQPGAWTTRDGQAIQIYDSRPAEGNGSAGEVMSVGESGIEIQSGDGRIVARRIRVAGGKKAPAVEWATELGIVAGDRLGT